MDIKGSAWADRWFQLLPQGQILRRFNLFRRIVDGRPDPAQSGFSQTALINGPAGVGQRIEQRLAAAAKQAWRKSAQGTPPGSGL
jgi:hypothetical protein